MLSSLAAFAILTPILHAIFYSCPILATMSQLTHTSTMYREMEEDLCDPTANLGFAEYDTATALGNPIIDLESGHDMAIFALGDPDLVPAAASRTLAR